MTMLFNSISIIGLGYIGLPTAAVLAFRMGNVIGVDVDQDVVEAVNAGKAKTVEPGLAALLEIVTAKGQLRAALRPEPADVFIIAVPTPITSDHKPDMSYVRAAAQSIAPVLDKGNLVILESTSPVSTTEQMDQWLSEARPDLSFPQQAGDRADVQIAYCPERILPGNMLKELANNDRIVGGLSEKASAMAADLYKMFVQGQIVTTNARTAEMCKLAENSFRDVNIAFANELSMICDKLDIDVWELIRLANRHPRVNILQPGCGVGGHCIPVDPWFIVDSAPEEARLIGTARKVNDAKTLWVVEKIKVKIADVLAEYPGKRIQDVTVACLGLAYKPDVNDFRGSPAFEIATILLKLNCKVMVVHIGTLPQNFVEKGMLQTPLSIALQSADIICVLVKCNCFVDVASVILEKNSVIDTVNLKS